MPKKPQRKTTMANLLRKAILTSGKTVNRIAIDSGVPQPVLQRFVTGKRPDLKLTTVQKLADYFGLELRAGGAKK